MSWTEIKITVKTTDTENASAIAQMTVPYGIYIEDYSNLEEEAFEIAHVDLIDEELLQKDRTHSIIHVYINPEENPAEAISFLKERFDSENIEYSIDTADCVEEDFINNWKKYFKPIPIGKKLLIRPNWIEDYERDGRAVLSIEPGLAFGTGTHATTRLCLEAIEENLKTGQKMLDLGCGSGILAVAGLLLGAESATGVDIDPVAVKTAVENGKENGFTEPKYRIIQGDLTDKITGKYDIITANIIADVIIYFSKYAGSFLAENGLFIVSGIINTREQDVLNAFEENNFEIVERRESEGWLCFTLKSKQ